MGVMESSRRRNLVQAISITPFTDPRYYDSVMDRDTTFCLEDDQETILEPKRGSSHWCYTYHWSRRPNRHLYSK